MERLWYRSYFYIMLRLFYVKSLAFCLCLTTAHGLMGQGTGALGSIGFYNVENLFDTVDDINVRDSEFLPGGDYKWSQDRYEAKLINISKVVSIMAGGPDILGLAEVENRGVIEDLVTRTGLASERYQILHKDSPDRRGIDVALIYKPGKFKPLHTEFIPFEVKDEPNFKTRDILWTTGIYNNDTLHVAVNHWPSRRGGKADKRLLAAEILRKKVDATLATNPNAKIVLMGDFNDDPNNKSMRKVLNAHVKLEKETLYNASMPTFKKGYGTLMYNGVMNLFDQIIISQGLLKSNSANYNYKEDSFTVIASEWMLERDKGGKPLRTFSAGAYKGGFSDHLPVLIYLEK